MMIYTYVTLLFLSSTSVVGAPIGVLYAPMPIHVLRNRAFCRARGDSGWGGRRAALPDVEGADDTGWRSRRAVLIK
ncbi:hypothetical protein DL96DRAFT_1589133 [Flagelloscypha sp. PMI_526]|nr:hypothetical protein DL96DRAFT_1589133 [Flagelloscypha sp. PMI_526]